jgi:cytochrome c-type biogenesis protein CcmH/NrfG
VSQSGEDRELLEEGDDDIVTSRGSASGAAGRRGWGKPWILAAVVVGIVIGVWMTGRDSAAPSDAPSAAPSAAPSDPVVATAPSPDPAARQADLEARLGLNPADVDAHLELGVILFNNGDLEAARAQWTTVTELDPSSALAWYDLGFYYLTQSPPDYAGAEAAWQRVIELDPQSDLAMTAQSHLAGLAPSPTGGQ